MSIAIHGESLGKRYRIGRRARSLPLRDRLTNVLKSPARWLRASAAGPSETGPRYIWAMRNVTFDLQEGEVLGLIGRNGAGKTTLLKILSRVTQPTEGLAEIRGRVGSLLEVGTGFHLELTGRENTYLNGAILGMGRKEIERKFEDIVAFAEVADFIDTPLKHYSTGMQMRLAFAVAAHFEPQILLVDEVLAVGDVAFQKKCLAKMGDVAHAGRTIVFVTHQMNQIRRLCEKVIWMDGGTIRKVGPTNEVVGAYESAMLSGGVTGRTNEDTPMVKARFLRWEIVDPRTAQPNVLETAGPLTLRFVVQAQLRIERAVHGVSLFDGDRRLIWGTGVRYFALETGVNELIHQIPQFPLKPGIYIWQVTLWEEDELVDSWDCSPDLIVATRPVTHWLDEWSGVLNIPSQFSCSLLKAEEPCETAVSDDNSSSKVRS